MANIQLTPAMTEQEERAVQNSNNNYVINNVAYAQTAGAATTQAVTDNSTKLATTAFIKLVLLSIHPIGDIKMSTVNVNPSTYIGGTWVAWGTGKVPVGVDTVQTEFNTVEKTGGVKTAVAEVEPHTHLLNMPQGSSGSSIGYVISGGADNNGYGVTQSSGSVGSHNNLQPYITCYMWKRTA